jgi:hypothetical protein
MWVKAGVGAFRRPSQPEPRSDWKERSAYSPVRRSCPFSSFPALLLPSGTLQLAYPPIPFQNISLPWRSTFFPANFTVNPKVSTSCRVTCFGNYSTPSWGIIRHGLLMAIKAVEASCPAQGFQTRAAGSPSYLLHQAAYCNAQRSITGKLLPFLGVLQVTPPGDLFQRVSCFPPSLATGTFPADVPMNPRVSTPYRATCLENYSYPPWGMIRHGLSFVIKAA